MLNIAVLMFSTMVIPFVVRRVFANLTFFSVMLMLFHAMLMLFPLMPMLFPPMLMPCVSSHPGSNDVEIGFPLLAAWLCNYIRSILLYLTFVHLLNFFLLLVMLPMIRIILTFDTRGVFRRRLSHVFRGLIISTVS